MSIINYRSRALAVGVLCAAGGAGAGAVASASASSSHTAKAHHAKAAGQHAKGRGHALRELARHSVSGSAVIHTKAGYKTVTFERGTVDSVNGDQLTITEGTPKSTYKQVTLTVPSSALVRDNRQKSSLSSLTQGERVVILSLPKRELVVAHTPKAAAGA